MSKRTIHRLPYGIRIVRDSEWHEYVVVDADGGTYHTNDKQDAIDTARSMWARAEADNYDPSNTYNG